jgi:hypothetical protein
MLELKVSAGTPLAFSLNMQRKAKVVSRKGCNTLTSSTVPPETGPADT